MIKTDNNSSEPAVLTKVQIEDGEMTVVQKLPDGTARVVVPQVPAEDLVEE